MTQPLQETKNCVVCGGETSEVLALGRQPLANQLLVNPDDPFECFELGLSYCPACSHGQLTHFVDPKILFQHYLYASGTSGTLSRYFDWFAAELRHVLKPAARVLEVACNDGTLLGRLSAQGFDAVGVDPAENLTRLAQKRGLDVLTGFFPQVAPAGLFDAIIAMNVLAHTPNPKAILEGIKNSLAAGGVAFVQTSQAMMLEEAQFDTIYHEHYSFFTPRSMQVLSNQVGLRLEKIILTSVHGGSAVFVLRHGDDQRKTQGFAANDDFILSQESTVATALTYPTDIEGTYQRFAEASQKIMSDARSVLLQCRGADQLIALTGVAAKSMTFIRAAQIDPDVYLDEADLKVDRYVPGTGKKIEHFSQAMQLPDDTVFLIGAWNFATEIKAKLHRHRPEKNLTAMTAFPSICVTKDKRSCVAS